MAKNLFSKYHRLALSAQEAGKKAFFVAPTGTIADVQRVFTTDEDGVARVYSTIDAAIGSCVADRGDIIYVLPGYTETLTSAGAIVADISGISIIGLGVGGNRPTLTFGTSTAASMTVSANNVKVENVIGVAGIDELLNPFNVTGNNCTLDLEWQDASSTVEAACAVRLDTADNAKLKLVYKGFTAGDALQYAVAVDNCTNADVNIDAYGICAVAWVDMLDAASRNVKVTGTMYTQGISNFTRDVVDTITGSTWSATIFDASFGGWVSGGSAAALASDDVSAVAAAVAAVQADLGNPSARTNLQTIEAMLGNPDTAGATLYAAVGGAAGLPTFPAGAQAANDVSIAEVVRYAQEALRVGTGGTALAADKSIYDALGTNGTTVADSAVSVLGAIGANNADNAFSSSSVVANADGSALEREEYIQTKIADAQGDITAIKAVTDVIPDAGAMTSIATAAAVTAAQGDITAIKAVTDVIPDAGAMTSIATAAAVTAAQGDITAIKAVTDVIPDAGAMTSIATLANQTASGTQLVIQKTLVSSAIVTGGVDVTGAASVGNLYLEDVIFETDATGLATATDVILYKSAGDGSSKYCEESIANLGANKTVDLTSMSVAKTRGTLAVGSKVQIKATVLDCTGSGTITISLVFRRAGAGATVSAA